MERVPLAVSTLPIRTCRILEKKTFDIDTVISAIDEAVRPFPKAALFALAEKGFGSPFEQLVACMLSIRTLDEVMLPTALALFERARTPKAITELGTESLDEMIRATTFHHAKAAQIQAIARRVDAEFGGELPCDGAVLQSFAGVGPKCANLVLGIACDQPNIGVDIHVHRVTNRWGYVTAATPEETMKTLEATLPRQYWVEINRLLVPFGKHICTGKSPRCSACPILDMCQQVGVTTHR